MPSKILTLNASPVISPSEDYLNKVRNGATPNQYRRLTSEIVRPAVREAFKDFSKDENNTMPNYTEILGRAISVLASGNSKNIPDQISALMPPMNMALVAVNRGGDLLDRHFLGFTKEDLQKSAAFAKLLVPKLQKLGEILGFTLTENSSTGAFLFQKNETLGTILDNAGSPIDKENLIIKPSRSAPIYLFNTDDKFAVNSEAKILEQFDKLIAEINKAAEDPQKDADIKGIREEVGELSPDRFLLADRIVGGNGISLSHLPLKQIETLANSIALTKDHVKYLGSSSPLDEVIANTNLVSVMGQETYIPELNEAYSQHGIRFSVDPNEVSCFRCQAPKVTKELSKP
jgi:hypothetical protein